MHVASIRDVKFLPVIFDVNFLDGLILSHVLHSFSHLMKLLPLLMIACFSSVVLMGIKVPLNFSGVCKML